MTTAAGTLLGLAAILILHRYPGIRHDAILYVGEGLMQRWPAIYGHDLFFMHGGQDRYSIFPWILGQAFRWITPPTAAMWGTLLSQLLFAFASWHCLRALLPARQRHWAWLGILSLPSMYGVVHIFSYNEPFLTSRPFSEALCLFAIGFLARKSWIACLFCLGFAGLLHPLQAMAALLVIWSWALMHDRRWLHALWLLLPIILLALTGIRPFDGLFEQTDPAWLGLLRNSKQLFVLSWDGNDYKTLAFDVFVLALSWRQLESPLKTWCAASLAGLALGYGANLVLVDGLHLVLPTGLQLWRAHWLAHWFSIAALCSLLFRQFNSGEIARAMLLGLAAQLAWGETQWGWLAMAALYLAWPWIAGGSRSRLQPLFARIFGFAFCLLFLSHAANELKWFRLSSYHLDQYAFDRRLLAFPAIALGLPLLGAHIWTRLDRTGRLLLLTCVLLPLVALGARVWDARAPVERIFDNAAYHADIFGTDIPSDAQVYWGEDSPLGTWLILRRANYFSLSQMAGQMFDRETAMDGGMRERRLFSLNRDSAHCRDPALPSEQRIACRISNQGMLQACSPGTPSGPDFIVLPYRQPQPASGSWTIKNPRTRKPSFTYWLYKCTDVMENLKLAERT